MKLFLPFFLTLFCFSSYVDAKIVEVSRVVKPVACSPAVGQMLDTTVFGSCALGAEYIPGNGIPQKIYKVSFSSSYASFYYGNNKSVPWFHYFDGSCSTPVDPETGLCDPPEPEPLFCDSQKVQDWILHDQSACQSNGGSFGYVCDDVKQEYSSSCKPKPSVCDENSPDWPACADVPECSMGNVGYPACLWPPEPEIPDNPNLPPSGGGDSGTGGGDSHDPTKPLDPNPEVPPVDTLLPEEGNGNLLIAISNLNSDNNKLISRLNGDINVGLSDVGSYLDVLNTNTIGLLELSRLGFDNINESINNQNDVIRQSGNMTNNYLDTLTNVTGNGLQDVVDALGAGKMVTPGSYVAPLLYSSHQMDTLDAEVAGLKIQYTNQLNEFKSYFNFKTDVDSGEYNPHSLKQRWGGQDLSFDNFVLKILVDNADIIGLIIIFGFGMAGIRVILETI